MKLPRFLPAAVLTLSVLAAGRFPLSAANPELPPPMPPGKNKPPGVPCGGPKPTQPCWLVKGGKAQFFWPDAPKGALWLGPVPVCAGGKASGCGPKGGSKGGSKGETPGQSSEPEVAAGPSGNRACPGHKDSTCQSSSVSAPGGPSSILERAFLDMAPNQPGMGTGSLVYYVDEPNSNFGSTSLLEFYSIPSMDAHYYVPGAGTATRYDISQPDGSTIIFSLDNAAPGALGLPQNPSAASQTGITWARMDGAAATKSNADFVRQFLPGYGWVHFPKFGGAPLGYTTLSGRYYPLSTASLAGMGIEILRKSPGGTISPGQDNAVPA